MFLLLTGAAFPISGPKKLKGFSIKPMHYTNARWISAWCLWEVRVLERALIYESWSEVVREAIAPFPWHCPVFCNLPHGHQMIRTFPERMISLTLNVYNGWFQLFLSFTLCISTCLGWAIHLLYQMTYQDRFHIQGKYILPPLIISQHCFL